MYINLKLGTLKLVQQKIRKAIIIAILLFSGTCPVLSQNIQVDFDNLTVRQVVDILKTKYNYSVSISASNVDMDKRISYKNNNSSIKELLFKVFGNQGLNVFVKDKIIIISSKKKNNGKQKKSNRNVVLKGKVVDESGNPVIGATVAIAGTTMGSVADLEGKFELMVNNSDTVIVSYLGLDTKKILVGGKSNLEIVLTSSFKELDQVVVTALGIKRSEKALSYNVQEVATDDIIKNKSSNFVNSLSGKVAGVTINSSSGGVGGASKVVMRGTKTIAQSSNALYVIDGIPMFNFRGTEGTEYESTGSTESIADINPEDIEKISVLTGAAAAALYGSNASNGVIVITTKKGKANVTSLTLTNNFEVMDAFVLPRFQNRYGSWDLSSRSKSPDKSWGAKLNNDNKMGYSPKKDFFQAGLLSTQTLAFSTGTDRNQTYLSLSNINSRGVVPNNAYSKFNVKFRNTSNFFNEKMTLDIGGSYIKQQDRNMINQGVYSNPLLSAYLFPRGDDWKDIKMYERYNSSRKINTQYWPQDIAEFSAQNPYWIAYRNLRENYKNRYMMHTNLSYDIIDWINVIGRVRLDNSVNNFEEKLYASSNKTLTEGSNNGFYGVKATKTKQTYADILLNIDKTFEEDYSLKANLGASYSDMQENTMTNEGPIMNNGIPNLFNVFQLDDVTTDRKQSGWRDQTQSIFASAELGYKGAYFLTLTGRNDWPSQLSGPNSDASSFFYPSVGTSVVLSQIFNMPKQIRYAKIRASFASVGLPFARFLANPTFTWDNDNKVWQTKSHYPLYNLKPERTNSWEAGLTSRFLKHFNLDFSWYYTKTFNQTFDPQISVSSGYSTLYLQTGNVKNTGIEFSLGYSNSWDDFSWSSNFTFSSNKNEIIELVDNYKHPETGAIITKSRLNIGGLSNAKFILKQGGSLGDLYSTADLKRDSDGFLHADDEGNISVDYKVDDIKLGSVFPKANISWRNDFSYKNFNLGFMFSARLGGVVYSATQATMDLYGVSESSANARDAGGILINGKDRISAKQWYTVIGAKSGIPQFYTYDATNVRLQEARIGYTIPKAKLNNIADVTFSFVGRNLFMIYNKAPFDPEAIASTRNYYQGIDYFMMPSLRSIGFNVRVKF